MDMKNYYRAMGVCVGLLAAVPAPANIFDEMSNAFRQKIDVNVKHPPSVPLKLTAVAIATPEGECSDGLASRVETNFVEAGITVIDRQRLAEIMAEHKLQVTQAFNQKSAAKLGALIGAQALLFIKVLDCHTAQDRDDHTDKKGRTTYTYTTQKTLIGSMRVVDLSTGRVLAAPRYEGRGETKGDDGYPDPHAAMEEAEKKAAHSIRQALLPWEEKKSLVFFSDTQCNLKAASVLLKSQDVDGALKQSEVNLAECKTDSKVKPNTLARAYYNLGVLQFIREDYEAAIANLTDAQKLDSGSAFVSALSDCRKAKDFAAQLATYNEDGATSNLSAAKSETIQKGSTPRNKQAQKAQSAGKSAEERLTKLDELQKKKLITQDEYNQRRKAIIDEI
jgi:hypothetical protein